MCLDGCSSTFCFEQCQCFKCACELSPCCKGCCTCCKCWTWCKYCCPCICWPPRQCMAWFLGLFGFVFMLLAISSHEWVMFGASGLDGPLRHADLGEEVTRSSWGLWGGSVYAGDEWRYAAKVETVLGEPKMEFDFDGHVPAWLGYVGVCLCAGEVVLLLGLVVVFAGLCACCSGCLAGGPRIKIFRFGMYLFLVADLLFFGPLVYFPFGLGLITENRRNTYSLTIPSTYGWAWGVVILVFVGAILLLLDKHVPPSRNAEAEKLLRADA